MQSQDDLRKLNAAELLDSMKSQHGDAWKDVWQNYIPVMKEYIRNYDRLELLNISTGFNKQDQNLYHNMDMTEHIARNNNARALLALIIPSFSAFVCVTLESSGFNYAYVYILMDDDKIKPMFISVGGNLVSSDGEWRSHMVDIGSYEVIIANYGHVIDKIYESMPRKLDANVHLFYSSEISKDITDAIHSFVDSEQYQTRLSTLAWFVGKYAQQMDILQHHTSKEFLTLIDDDVDIINIIGQQTADKLYIAIGSTCGCIYSAPELGATYPLVRTGQKLIQLTPDELSHTLDDSFQTWNEIKTTWRAMDLVLNFISPSFVMQSGWFFVYNVNKMLFNLPTSHERIAMSDSIRTSPNDIRSDKVLSDVAICMINEYGGSTFIDMLNRKSTSAHMLEFGKRYVFDIIYALYCINTKLKKIHGDFHGNNATIAQWSNVQIIDDSFVVYTIDNANYAWPHRGMYGCIIDFSRVTSLDDPIFVERVLEKYEIYFKSFTSINYEKIISRVTNVLDDSLILDHVIKKITAFDIYEFTNSVLARCADVLDGTDLKTLLTRIKSDAENILLSIVDDDNDDVTWANMQLIKKYYKPSDVLPEIQKIRGHFNYNNELLYSASCYEKLPPSLAASPMIQNDHDKPVKTYSSFSLLIKTRYKLMEIEERLLRGF